jgi:hypothetical protein
MTTSDDYENDMREAEDLSDRDIERLLEGKAPQGRESLSDLAGLFAEARFGLVDVVDETTRRVHLAAIVEEVSLVMSDPVPVASAAGSGQPVPSTWRRVMHRTTSLALKLVAGTGAAVLSVAGLAYAGVDLPGTTAEDAVEVVLQVELPNQEDSKSRAAAVEATKEAFGDERGCEFGQAVSATASANSPNAGMAPKQDPCVKGDEGQSDNDTHGKSGEDHGNATDESGDHGKSGEDHGKPDDVEQDQSGEAPGRAEDKVRGKSGDAPAGKPE